MRDKIGLFGEADNGMIFLDEIGDLPLYLQVKLLRVIEDKMIRPLGSTEPVRIDSRLLIRNWRRSLPPGFQGGPVLPPERYIDYSASS